MTHKIGLTLATFILAIAGMVGPVSKSAAGAAQEFSGTPTDISAAKRGGGARSGGRGGARHASRGGARHVSRGSIRHSSRAVRHIGRSSSRHVRGPGIHRHALPRNVGKQPKVTQQLKFDRIKIRDAHQAKIAGRNYSIWRGSHRVRRGGGWRTFVGLGTLTAIAVGSAQYYPYAYIDAPAPLCEGLTEDGCQLRWQAVPTVEGPTEFQCVAYCPWR